MTVKQDELDLMEREILTDFFGGTSRENFIMKFGIFKYDLSSKIQKYINKMEDLLNPIMDDNGMIDVDEVRKYISLPAEFTAKKQFRPVEFYRTIRPMIKEFVR